MQDLIKTLFEKYSANSIVAVYFLLLVTVFITIVFAGWVLGKYLLMPYLKKDAAIKKTGWDTLMVKIDTYNQKTDITAEFTKEIAVRHHNHVSETGNKFQEVDSKIKEVDKKVDQHQEEIVNLKKKLNDGK